MENFLNSLPKPILVVGIFILFVLSFYIFNPPHTICDTQKESVQELFKGILYPTKFKKSVIPPQIIRAKETCLQGVSSGACYEYFSVLKNLAKEVLKAPLECSGQVYEIKEISHSLTEGIEKMSLVAWGEQPPEPGVARFGWFKESELLLFCILKDAYVRAHSEAAWGELRSSIYKKYPGEALVLSKDPGSSAAVRIMAPQKFSEGEIWNRSLFSIRCENYR